MCGILGILGESEPDRFESALHRLTHRGPDGFGIWHEPGIWLGHRRLAILDLSDAGKQPMEVLDRYVVTFNGEIYNYREIRKELEQKGIRYRSDSDTEVLLHAYVQWGPACLHRFNGMWAFAIWDKQERTLFISRDRFGKKPFFYAMTPAGLVFASEMKAMFPYLKAVQPSKDFQWCADNILRYESTDKCLVEGIKRFPAGHHAIVSAANPTITPTRYWDTREHLVEQTGSYEEQVERFRELFTNACRLRMRSDVPIGTALSGGFDSSATICTMAHIGNNERDSIVCNDWQHAFVGTFPGTIQDETFYAQKVVDHIDINATFLEIDPAGAIDDLERQLYMFEELYSTSPIPMMATYRAVRENNVTVTLDGHGADELLAGYGQDVFRAFDDCGLSLRKIKDVLAIYRGMIDIDNDQIRKTNYDLSFYIRRMGGKKAWLRYALKRMFGRHAIESPEQGQFGSFNSHLYDLFHTTVLPTLLRNYDRYAMANGIEIRMPFMDHELVSFAFSLPWTSKIGNGYTKRIARDALSTYIPKEVTERTTKLGFNTPIVEWMRGEWKPYLLDTVHSSAFVNSNLVDAKDVKAKIEHVINDASPSLIEGERAWTSLTPFLWENAILRNWNKHGSSTAAPSLDAVKTRERVQVSS